MLSRSEIDTPTTRHTHPAAAESAPTWAPKKTRPSFRSYDQYPGCPSMTRYPMWRQALSVADLSLYPCLGLQSNASVGVSPKTCSQSANWYLTFRPYTSGPTRLIAHNHIFRVYGAGLRHESAATGREVAHCDRRPRLVLDHGGSISQSRQEQPSTHALL